MTTHESCYDAEAEGKARMGKREQISLALLELQTAEALMAVQQRSPTSMTDLGIAVMLEDGANRALAKLVLDNEELFANSEATAAERDQLKAEVARLRGVIEEVANWFDDEAALTSDVKGNETCVAEYSAKAAELRAALQPQTTGGEE